MCIRDRARAGHGLPDPGRFRSDGDVPGNRHGDPGLRHGRPCLLYTSDAADERSSVDLGGRRIIKKKNSTDIGGRAQ